MTTRQWRFWEVSMDYSGSIRGARAPLKAQTIEPISHFMIENTSPDSNISGNISPNRNEQSRILMSL
ncbi:MAG: hypothetical protein P8104_00545 [Gammaproteobacteria bacterium]